jgi:hypothetical protein
MSMNKRTKILIGAGIVGVAILGAAVAATHGFPPREGASGAIGAVKKLNDQQIDKKDVILGSGAGQTPAQAGSADATGLANAAALDNSQKLGKIMPDFGPTPPKHHAKEDAQLGKLEKAKDDAQLGRMRAAKDDAQLGKHRAQDDAQLGRQRAKDDAQLGKHRAQDDAQLGRQRAKDDAQLGKQRAKDDAQLGRAMAKDDAQLGKK